MEVNKIYNTNSIDFMKNILSDSIDLVVTDPPYKITARGNAGNSGGMMQKNYQCKERFLHIMILNQATTFQNCIVF